MKRLDLLFAFALSALALFVGAEALATHQSASARHVENATGSSALEVSGPVSSPADVAATTRAVEMRRPVADLRLTAADVRHRLVASAPGTYIGEVLSAHDSSLARWPDRRLQPLRIWIEPVTRVRDWSPSFVTLVREAFIDWGDTGIPLNFTFVLDSVSADVHVSWIDRFDEPISGKTLWTHDDAWWILEANIVLAVHHRTGEALDTAAMRAIALHEVGHLMGLDHTTDSTSIMTPRVRVKTLSAADRATAQLLYLLPPGRIGRVSR